MKVRPALRPEQVQAWQAYVEATRLLFDRLDDELKSQSDMSLGDYSILSRLAEAPDRTLRMSRLAQLTASSRSRLSHAMDRLEKHSWVERKACPTDRRGSFAVLTEAGMAALERTAPHHAQTLRSLVFERLTAAETQQLQAIAKRIAAPLTEAKT